MGVLFCEGLFDLRFLFCRKVIFLEVLSIATKELCINEEIRVKEVRLIDDAGEHSAIQASHILPD